MIGMIAEAWTLAPLRESCNLSRELSAELFDE
jgi:hypothetical protein